MFWFKFIVFSPLLLLLTILQSRSILSYMQKSKVRYFYHTNGRKNISLTIDDGPDNCTTPEILAILKKHNVKATFFVIGERITRYPEIVQMILKDGHNLGNLGNHDLYDKLSVWRQNVFMNNFNVTHTLLESCLRKFKENNKSNSSNEKRLFRPGCGFYSQWMLDGISKLNYSCILGSIYPHDVMFSWYQFVARYLYHRASPGSIMIIHDSRPHLETEKTLDMLIPWLKAEGYNFKTIYEMETQYPEY